MALVLRSLLVKDMKSRDSRREPRLVSYFSNNLESDNGRKAEIPLGARIVAVTDSFDAMTTDRPYRKGMAPWQALEEIAANSGKQFDPAVVEAFHRVLDKKLETI